MRSIASQTFFLKFLLERSKRIQADQMMQIVTTYTSCPLNRRVASYERADCARIGIVEIIIVDEVIATAGPLRQERARWVLISL
jgi:hypothetical protein